MHVNKIFTANSISNSEMEANIQQRNGKINCGIFKERNDEINQLLKDRIHHPKICHFGIQIILSCRHLKRQLIHRAAPFELLWSAQTGKLKKELSWGVPSSLLQNFINQGKLTLTQKRRLEVDTTVRQTLSQTVTPPISSYKSHSLFLQIISPPWGTYVPSPLSLLRW